jgi:pimeloyl-ACP methyl ester carboxylesterase
MEARHREGRRTTGALNAATIVVPGAAHMIPMTHPGAFVEVVRGDGA